MKNNILLKEPISNLFLMLFTAGVSFSQSIESKIGDFAKNEYPNGSKMQKYI